jgi:hypothetical protein
MCTDHSMFFRCHKCFEGTCCMASMKTFILATFACLSFLKAQEVGRLNFECK